MDTAPAVTAVGHVAVLALDALAREPARLPLVIGALEQLAVEREAVGRELMAALAELGPQEGRRAGDPVVGQGLTRSRAGERAVAPGRAEPRVTPHVAARARHALAGQRGVVIRVGLELAPVGDERRLLGERRVADQTLVRGRWVVLPHLDELAGDAGAACGGVHALAPVGELRRMAGPARLRMEGGLQRREPCGGRTLRRQRLAPVASDELLDEVGAGGGRGGQQHGRRRRARGTKAKSHRREHDSVGRLLYSMNRSAS